MFDAAGKAFAQLLTPALSRVLLKAAGLALALIVLIGIALHRALSALAESGATWAEHTSGWAPHTVWSLLASMLSIMAAVGIVTGAVFLMPAVTSFVGSFFVDETAEAVEREYYPSEPVGRALPLTRALVEGIKIGLLAVLVYLCALPFMLFFGFGLVILFVANAYLLGRMYFELAAMRFRPPDEAKAMRRANAGYIFMAGVPIATFVSVPVANLATPVLAMAYMVHIHKHLSGARVELIAPAR
jgi:CysZ protein